MKAGWSRFLPYFLLVTTAFFFPSLLTAQTWNLEWSDEFTGAASTSPSSANWGYEYGNLNVNNELEFYCGPPGDPNNQSPCTNASNVFLDGSGYLVIQAHRVGSGTAAGSNSWTSTRMNTNGKQQFTFGRLEASMQLPTGPGLWPAFWALGTNISSVGWPTSGEIDFMENVPSPPSNLGPTKIASTIHGGASPSNCYCGGNGLSGIFTLTNSDVTSFHIYGGIWSPYMVQFYVDSPSNVFEVRTANDIPSSQVWDFNHPFYLLLNLAVGGTGSWPGPPGQHHADSCAHACGLCPLLHGGCGNSAELRNAECNYGKSRSDYRKHQRCEPDGNQCKRPRVFKLHNQCSESELRDLNDRHTE